MTEREKMNAGLIYDPANSDIMMEQVKCQELLYDYNMTRPSEYQKKEELLKRLFGKIGRDCYIEVPLRANWGGRHVFMGNQVYANFNLTLVDDGNIYIGDKVMFGPNVTIATANHPIEPSLRERVLQYNKEVRIGNNVWIGSGVIIVPGITIGDNSVIGAGSVVTKDIPKNVVAYGNPCKVIREIGSRDHVYFYKDEKINWSEL